MVWQEREKDVREGNFLDFFCGQDLIFGAFWSIFRKYVTFSAGNGGKMTSNLCYIFVLHFGTDPAV